jgi:hypothetical protein
MDNLPLNVPKTHLTQALPFDPKWQIEIDEEEDLESQMPWKKESSFDIDKIIQKIENKENLVEVESDASSE